MRRLLVMAGALALMSGGALAGPPTGAQKTEFYQACLKVSDNSTLCRCKADMAMKLLDADFMAVVIGQMQGRGGLTEAQGGPYGVYISKSNAVCAPGM